MDQKPCRDPEKGRGRHAGRTGAGSLRGSPYCLRPGVPGCWVGWGGHRRQTGAGAGAGTRVSSSGRWSCSDPAGRCHLFFSPDTAEGVKFRGGESSNRRPRPLLLREEGAGVGTLGLGEEGWGLGRWVRRRAEVCILASDGRGLGPKGL